MNKLLKTIFNGGDNDGDIIITSIDKKIIKCHYFILKYFSEFFKSDIRFTNLKNVTVSQDSAEINLNYSSKIIRKLLNRIYDDNITLTDLDINEVLEMFELIDFLQIYNSLEVISDLKLLLNKQLTVDNCVELLQKTFPHKCYNPIKDIIYEYFKEKVIPTRDLYEEIKNDHELTKEIRDKILSLYAERRDNKFSEFIRLCLHKSLTGMRRVYYSDVQKYLKELNYGDYTLDYIQNYFKTKYEASNDSYLLHYKLKIPHYVR